MIFVFTNNSCVYASDNAGYRNILTEFKADIKNKNLIIPGQSVGLLNIGKPIPYSFIKFYGAPDSYSEPRETKDSGSLSWYNKLLIKLNDLKDKKNIFSIFIEDPIFKTAKGIGVGSKFEDLKNKYPNGKEHIDGYRGTTAWKLDGITFFISEQGNIYEIFIAKWEIY